MQLNHQTIQILHHAIEELGGGKYVFNSQTTYRIARHARKLREVAQDVESARAVMAKRLEENPDQKAQVEDEWRAFLKEEVSVDAEANLNQSDLNLWDEGNKEGNKIPASLLASLEPLLEDKD